MALDTFVWQKLEVTIAMFLGDLPLLWWLQWEVTCYHVSYENDTGGFTSIKLGLRKWYNKKVYIFYAISANSRTDGKYTSGDVFSVLWCNHWHSVCLFADKRFALHLISNIEKGKKYMDDIWGTDASKTHPPLLSSFIFHWEHRHEGN